MGKTLIFSSKKSIFHTNRCFLLSKNEIRRYRNEKAKVSVSGYSIASVRGFGILADLVRR